MSFPDLPIPTQIVPFFFTPPTGQLASYPAIASQAAKTAEVWSKQFRNIHMHPPITRTAVIFLTTLTYSYQSTTTTSTTYAPSISKYYLLSPTTRARRGKRLTQYVPSKCCFTWKFTAFQHQLAITALPPPPHHGTQALAIFLLDHWTILLKYLFHIFKKYIIKKWVFVRVDCNY